MKKIFLVMSIFVLFGGFTNTFAAIKPSVVTNTETKECRVFQSSSRVTLSEGWIYHHDVDYNNASEYCRLLGYTYSDESSEASSLKPIYKILPLAFIAVFILIATFLYLKLFKNGQRSYIKLFVILIILAIVFLYLYPQILSIFVGPCAAGLIPCFE